VRLNLRTDRDGRPRIELDGESFVEAVCAVVPNWQEHSAECVSTPWRQIEGNDALGPFTGLRSTLSRAGEEVVDQAIRNYGSLILFSASFLQTVEGTRRSDSFETPSVYAPQFVLPDGLRVCLATHGLGSSDDAFGGYWPMAQITNGNGLPSEAFAPMVVFDQHGALAIAPSNHFLTASLVSVPSGVARGMHGSIDRFEAGVEIETLFVPSVDVSSALMALGDVLLRRGGKQRPNPSSHPVTSSIGWWNAYGGYYTEPIHPLDATELENVVKSAQERDLPIRYLGLDLWYPYRHIGQGIEFAPDPQKYPEGIGDMARSASLHTVLHVSALAQPNAYGSDGSDGTVYETIGDEIRRQEGVAVWHDWMRTQQHLTPRLRNPPRVADAWYRKMTTSLANRGLEVLQCMQTMGMALASTQAPNVRSARTYIDYLFALPEAIQTLADLGEEGFRREALRPVDLSRQNLLMGTFLYALGLLPFHDLFLTRFHEGIGGSHPEEDAILRALSCGPVGIGDAPGETDAELLAKLILPDGRLLQPDRPPFPVADTLSAAVETYWTLHQAGDYAWLYVVLLNLSSEAQEFDIDPPIPGDYVLRDGISGSTADEMAGELAGGQMAYYVLAPIVNGIAPLGLLDKFVPGPAERFVSLRNGALLTLGLDNVEGSLGFLCEEPIEVRADGRPLAIDRDGDVTTVAISAEQKTVEVRRR